jgi:nucleoside-diphosphate-sugar epimerase
VCDRARAARVSVSEFETAHGSISRGSDSTEQDYRDLYYGGAHHCVDVFRPARFVFASSTGVFQYDDGRVCDDDSPRTPDANARTKAMVDAEDVVLANPHGVGLVARLGGLYGSDRGFLISSLRSGKASLDADGGLRHMNFIWREDAVAALLALATQPALERSAAFNVVDNGGVTQHDYLRFLCAELQLDMPAKGAPNPAKRHGIGNKRVVATRLKQLCGWQPSMPTLIDGLKALLGAEQTTTEARL